MRERIGYLTLVRQNPDFRHLWYGQIVSLFGDWFNLIASASLVANLTGSGLAVGGLFVVRMIAPFLVSPLAGVAADRFNRKKLLIATDLVRAVVVMGFLLVREPSQVWLLYAITFVQLTMHGVFFPTRNAILPDLVAPEALGAANAITSTTWSVMLATGAAVGGLVSGGFGVYPAFVVDSLTFLVSATFIARIHYQPHTAPTSDRSASPSRVLSDYVAGLRYLRENTDILVIVLHKAMLTLFVAGIYEVVQVELARDVYVIGKGGGISLGILYAFIGFGSGIGPILARSLTGDEDRPMRIALIFAYLTMSLGLGIMSFLPAFGWTLLGTTIRAMGGGTLWVFSTQLLLQSVPQNVRGRVFSTEYALLTLSMATSAAAGGLALDRTALGLGEILRTMAFLIAVPGILWALRVFRDTRPSAT